MRTCGSRSDRCTLCCKLLPVDEGLQVEMLEDGGVRTTPIGWHKGANEKCRHQSAKGCRVHGPKMPMCCGMFSCAWLSSEEATRDLARPDRSHYVIDINPDFIRVTVPPGESVDIPAVQVWVDPAYPDAHEDPNLRAWFVANHSKVATVMIIRYSEKDGFTLFPPALTNGRGWVAAPAENTPELGEERWQVLAKQGRL